MQYWLGYREPPVLWRPQLAGGDTGVKLTKACMMAFREGVELVIVVSPLATFILVGQWSGG